MNAEYFQCCQCGAVHIDDISKCEIEDDIYVYTQCLKCRDVTKHLMCGDREEDIYRYYNPVMDKRYY